MIEFKDVVKSYEAKVPAVKHLNLMIEDGECCVLLGASGCGKSTTLNMVNRLIEPDSGEIFINGKNIDSYQPEELRRSIGYVVQSIGLFPNMTVAKNIAVVPSLLKWERRRIRTRVEELLDMVGLNPERYGRKYPFQLSGGEAQRIGVARALAADPAILLMDEPFGAVDPLNRTKLQNEFLNLQKRLHKTVIFVTHDINEAMKMGDRIALMKGGTLQGYGTPYELLKDKDNEFVREFMGSDSFINILTQYRVDNYAQRGHVTSGLRAIPAGSSLKDALAAMIEWSCSLLAVAGPSGEASAILSVEAIIEILKEGQDKR